MQGLQDEKMFSAPCHQQANGLIERLFKTIKPMLVITANQRNKGWDEVIPTVELVVQAAIQTSMGYSPFEIVYGSSVKLPWELGANHGLQTKWSNIKDYVAFKEMYQKIIIVGCSVKCPILLDGAKGYQGTIK